jgi:circadian clock protein KaiC
VVKLRGVKFREGWHDYAILTGGLKVFPRLVAAEHHVEFKREPASSGIKELDSLLGGGLDRGTTTLILGAAGTGKSSLALHYAVHFARQGERAMVFTFDETLAVMLARAEALGLDLRPHLATGLIQAQQVDPAELSPGEFAVRVQQGIAAGARLVVIDSLNGYLQAMPGDKYLSNQLHELSSYLNQQGVLTIIIMAQHGFLSTLETPVDISYLADTVLTLRFFEAGGSVKQALSIVKKRSGQHERTIREFRLESGHGVRIGPPLKEFQGVLSGLPVYRGRGSRMLKYACPTPTSSKHRSSLRPSARR